jgi:hypothetical protein
MKKRNTEQEEEFEMKIRPRETEVVSLAIPQDVLASIEKVAANRDMSAQALLKLYIGQGLRQDLTRFFGDHLLQTTEQVLTRHIKSSEEISSIIREIQSEAAAYSE